MKRLTLVLAITVAYTVLAEHTAARGQPPAGAGVGLPLYGGYQPWWKAFPNKDKKLSPEEEKLQQFWKDYYDSLKRYYGELDHIDWVAYYKNHGYQINAGCGAGGCCGSKGIQFAPVFINPKMQWAVPNGVIGSPLVPSPASGVPPKSSPGGSASE
jgi:hypothetical protein